MSAVDDDIHTNSHRGAENASTGSTERPSGMSATVEALESSVNLTELRELAEMIRDTCGSKFQISGDETRDVWAAAKQLASGLAAITPPPPEPSPLDLIPVGRENAADLYVNGVPGRYFRSDAWIELLDPDGLSRVAVRAKKVETVTPIRTLADDDVAVKRDVLKSILEAPESGLTNRDHDELVAALAKAGDPS